MTPNPITDRVERLAQAIAEHVVNVVLEAVDIDRLVERVNVDAVLDRVNVDAVLERIDVDALVRRIDVNAVVEQVDVNAVVERLDIDALVSHTELGAIIAKSTTSVMTEVLDLVRAQGVGVDDFIARWANRVLRRRPDTLPLGPALLVAPAPAPAPTPPGTAGAAGT